MPPERKDSCLIQAPVGMYNLGNTCFMSCILQCLIHCIPLQRHFLRDVGHHYKSCELIRSAYGQNGSTSTGPSTLTKPVGTEDNKPSICLACEMDKLFLQYFGSSIGRDVNRAVCQAPHPLDRYENSIFTEENYAKNEFPTRTLQGDPLITTELLASAWKSGGMDHLAGYEQGDAHEFLQAFLDTVGKHCGEYRKLIRFMQRMALPSNAKEDANVNKQNVGKFLCCLWHFLSNLSHLTFVSLPMNRQMLSSSSLRELFALCSFVRNVVLNARCPSLF